MIGQFEGRQKTNVYGWVSDLAVARSGFNQIAVVTYMSGMGAIDGSPSSYTISFIPVQ